jgi:hypothetical protein
VAADGAGEFLESAVFLGGDEGRGPGLGGGWRSSGVFEIGAQPGSCPPWDRRGELRRLVRGGAGQEVGDPGDPLVDLAAQGPAVRCTRGLDVFEGDGLAGVLGTDRPAEDRLRWNTRISVMSRGS